MEKAWNAARIDLLVSKKSIIATIIVFALIFLQYFIIYPILNMHVNTDNSYVSLGNILLMVVILIPIFMPTSSFRKLINLGMRKKDFYEGTFLCYVTVAIVLAIINICFYYIETAIVGSTDMLYLNILPVFNWFRYGVIGCFIYQAFFYLLVMVFINLIAISNDNIFGWIISALIITIISVFCPIEPLRNWLGGFLKSLIFNDNLFFQVLFDSLAIFLMYRLSYLFLKRKNV